MRQLLAMVLSALLVTLGACSGAGDADDGQRELRTLPRVEREVPTTPDRDRAGVEQKLAAVDACSLVRPTAMRAVGDDPATVNWGQLHTCYVGSDPLTRFEVGQPLTPQERFRMERISLSGAVAYRTPAHLAGCTVSLPVSQELAVIVTSSEGSCDSVTTYADGAAGLLMSRPGAAGRPQDAGRFSACQLLAPALPPELTAAPGVGGEDMIDQCTATSEGTSSPEAEAQLELDAAGSVSDNNRAREFAGVLAIVATSNGRCQVEWELPDTSIDPPFPDADTFRPVATAELWTDTCARARRIVPLVDAATRRTPPAGSPADLLYPWSDEVNDLAVVGACGDIMDAEALSCAPARPVDAPEDRSDLLEQAEADPDVLCTAVAPIVAEHFPDLAPATIVAAPVPLLVASSADEVSGCAFGEPTHALHLRVHVSTTGAELVGVREETEIAGRSALTLYPDHRGEIPSQRFQVALDDGSDTTLMVTVDATPPRDSRRTTDADPTPIEASEQLVIDLVRRLAP